MREELKNSNRIELTTKNDIKRTFEILNIIGYGATCIVYNACFYDEYEIRHYVKVKECFPLSGTIGRRGQDVIWRSNEAKNTAFKAFEKMYAQHMKLQEMFDVVNATCKIADFLYYGNDTVYLIMEFDYGISFDKAVPDTLYEILQVIYALSNTIGKYHEIGFLHLDIKPQNFMVMPETKELVKLFDFDSLVSLHNINMGIADNISYSNEWAAPEIKQKRLSKIRETADVYSVGAVLFYALFGRNIETKDKLNYGKYNLNEINVIKNVNPLVKRKLNEFLSKALNPVIAKRYQNMDEVKQSIKDIMVIADPTRNYLCSSIPEQINYFNGRENELVQAWGIINEFKRVIITGIGGIGKSEFSKQYAHIYRNKYSSVVWVKCEGSFADTVMSSGNFVIATGKNDKHSKEYSSYEEKIDVINSVIDEDSLIVIDDVKDFSEKALQLFLRMQCNIMITTRTYSSLLVSNMQSINLECMENVKLRNIFDHYYKKVINTSESIAVNEIITSLGGYTLLIPIIAKQMTVSGMKPSDMLRLLKENGVAISLPEKVQHIKDEELIDEVLIGHLKKVFDLSGMDENKLLVFRVLSMLDSISIGKKSLAAWCGFRTVYIDDVFYGHFIEYMNDRVDLSTVNELINAGWLQYDEISDRVSIHNVFSELILKEYVPNIINCQPFINTMEKVAEDIEGWKKEVDEDNMLWYDSINEYEVNMYLHVMKKFISKLRIENIDTVNVVIHLIDKIYKVNTELFVDIIDKLLEDKLIHTDIDVSLKLRKMQVYVYFFRYIYRQYFKDGTIDQEFNEAKAKNATIKLKETVRFMRSNLEKPKVYDEMLELFEAPQYICINYVNELFSDQNENETQYKYMLKLLNEIDKGISESKRKAVRDLKTLLISEHRGYVNYKKRYRNTNASLTQSDDIADVYTHELNHAWNDMEKTFKIVSRVMSDTELNISGKQCVISNAGFNSNEFWLRRSIRIGDKSIKKEELSSSVHLEAMVYIKEMARNGLFKEGMSVALWNSMDKALLYQYLYSNEYIGLIKETKKLIETIYCSDECFHCPSLKVSEWQWICNVLEYFELDILALWIYRTIDEVFIGKAEDYYFLDVHNSYDSFISCAMECAERMGDYESYYYFFNRMRDKLNVDFTFETNKKTNVVKGNSTLKIWKDYVYRLDGIKNEGDVQQLYNELIENDMLTYKVKQILLKMLEEKVSLRRLRFYGDCIFLRYIVDTELKNELETKYFQKDIEYSLECIDDISELIFQYILSQDYDNAEIWINKYIRLIGDIYRSDQDAVNVWRFSFLPNKLYEMNHTEYALRIFKAMISNWLNYSIEKYNYYLLKINEVYLDKIYEIAGTKEEIDWYKETKEKIIDDWGGEEHLALYI